jgi:hypothetical protein
MEHNNDCPFFIDCVRECASQIGNISREFDTTIKFCISTNHSNCPFFKYLSNQEKYCEYFKGCSLCGYYKANNLEEFIVLAEAWCFKDFATCARYKMRKSGGMPAPNMLPDSSIIKE